MNVGGITERIVKFANACVGRFTGGLGLTTVMSCMVFSGVSGSAVADASALGKVLIPGMKRQGYDSGFAASVTAAASVMGPIIPPSIPLVIYGLSVGKGVSVAALFLGGVVPGIALGIGLGIVVYLIAKKRGLSQARGRAAPPARLGGGSGRLGAVHAGVDPRRHHRRRGDGDRRRSPCSMPPSSAWSSTAN